MSKVGVAGKQRRFEAHVLKSHKRDALSGQGGCCRYCFEPLTAKKATADHLLPKSKGGTNVRANIVAACAACNVAKGSLSLIAFTAILKADHPSGATKLMMAWFRRRLWRATHRANRHVRLAVGLDNNTPIGRKAA